MTQNIHLTFLGHSCVLIDVGGARLLLDPGNLTPPLDGIGAVDAVLVTHGHPDHLDAEQVRRVTGAGKLPLYGPPDIAGQVEDLDVAFVGVRTGSFEVAGVPIVATVSVHETLYPGFPLPANVGYEIGGRIFAPGDALTVPSQPIEVLLAPLAGPWMKLSEGIDFIRAVAPDVVVPVHDAGLAPAHRGLHRALFTDFGPTDSTFTPLDPGQSITL
ncbi:MBL fold metallo-hydrolase [Gordonia sp. TBRC 11910]|uniref:MBL fold metallo-hydrolase n=1 Tax=Gordonia asplenii TaxID=2725283 RepID=A0A848L0Z2_9ACTN|nr:MBL fold metallo-hydrolase [Gordonia asplenii]NMO04466.1 MBL fold metallo-hydrolase [Gordonia asplenii]